MSEPSRRRRTGLERARWDIEQGCLWKARDRLAGLLSGHEAAPHIPEQEVLELLGEVFYAMGDLPQAGRYWFLTERSGEDVDKALAALFARYGRKAVLLQALPFRRHVSEYPAVVQQRVDSLEVDSADLKRLWAVNPAGPATGRDWDIAGWVFGAVLLSILACAVVGFVVVVRFLLGLV